MLSTTESASAPLLVKNKVWGQHLKQNTCCSEFFLVNLRGTMEVGVASLIRVNKRQLESYFANTELNING